MAGLSFLVSPQTQQQQKDTAESFQHGLNLAYTAEHQQQQLAEQEHLKDQEIQAAEQRNEAATQRAYGLQADRDKNQMDLTETRGTLAQKRENVSKMWSNWDLLQKQAGVDKAAMEANAPKYGLSQDATDAYSQKYNDAMGQSQNQFQAYVDKYSNLKPDEHLPPLDYSQLPISQLHYSLDNPYIQAKYKATLANLESEKQQRDARVGQIVQKMGQMPTEASNDLNNMLALHSEYKHAVGDYQAFVASGGRDPATLAKKQLAADNAQDAYNAASQKASGWAADGHYGPKLQQTIQSMRAAWGDSDNGMNVAPSGSQGQPQGTGLPTFNSQQPIGLQFGVN